MVRWWPGGYNKNGQCDVSGWKLFDNFDDVVNRAVAEEEKRKAAAEKRRLDRIAALEAEKQRIETELPHIKGLFSGRQAAGYGKPAGGD